MNDQKRKKTDSKVLEQIVHDTPGKIRRGVETPRQALPSPSPS
jgi:hypothetical protein